MREDYLEVENFARAPEKSCVCGRLYSYAGIVEPGQYDPDCPVHGEERS